MVLIVLLIHGNWLFALMSAAAMISPVAWFLMRRHTANARRTDDGQRPPARESSACDKDAILACPPLEPLVGMRGDPRLWWRIIAGMWAPCLSGWAPPMRVPIGMCDTGELALDLSAQGTHALVAGTTGSGKSVVLRTWCLALACRYPPTRVQFVFLDFKGGAGLDALADMPHTVGTVCDLDLRHARRALLGIEKELTRREMLVAKHHVSDTRDLPIPPATMMIVVDEFHALRGRLPDYIDRLTTIASLGRSLGMHLIACTQNPLGQVGSDMKANLSLRICLRVKDSLQSVEMIGNGSAALISPRSPGLGYVDDGESIRRFRCSAAQSPQRLVASTITAMSVTGIPPQPPLFSRALPRSVPLTGLSRRGDANHPDHVDSGRRAIAIGLSDDGIHLTTARLPIGDGTIIITGPRGRGKTTLLRTILQELRTHGGVSPVITLISWPRRTEDANGGHRHVLREITIGSEHDAGPTTETDDGAGREDGHRLLLVDDADALLDPLSTDPLSNVIEEASHDTSWTVVAAASKTPRSRLDGVSTRIVFPSGDRAIDAMDGIPSNLLGDLDDEDYSIPGRAVLIRAGTARMIQCAIGKGGTEYLR